MALGPLGLRHDDLWRLTPGEVQDLAEGYRYREYLEARRQARFARWILSAWCRKVPSVDEMTGVWDNGEIMTPLERYHRAKERIAGKRGEA